MKNKKMDIRPGIRQTTDSKLEIYLIRLPRPGFSLIAKVILSILKIISYK